MYDILSPDGFSISMVETWETEKLAEIALTEWVNRYSAQGYYSTSDRTKIPFEEIKINCTIIKIES